MFNEKTLPNKLSSLLWIPNGEIDDTRFEKLFDDLKDWCAKNEDTISIVFKSGILDILPRSIKHEDERIRSISFRLLGSFHISTVFQNHRNEYNTILELISNIILGFEGEETPVELAGLLEMISHWIAYIPQTEAIESQIHKIINNGLTCTSHFVQTEALKAIHSICVQESNNFENIASSVIESIHINENHFNNDTVNIGIIDAIIGTKLSSKLQKIAQKIVWKNLQNFDPITAERTRCCLRRIIYTNSYQTIFGNNDTQSFLKSLNSVVKNLIDAKKNSSAIAIIDLKEHQIQQNTIGDQYHNVFHDVFLKWSQKSIESLLSQESLLSTSKQSQDLEDNVFMCNIKDLTSRAAILDQIIGIFVKKIEENSELKCSSIHAELTEKMIKAVSVYIEEIGILNTGPNHWKLINNFLRFLLNFSREKDLLGYSWFLKIISFHIRTPSSPIYVKLSCFRVLESILQNQSEKASSSFLTFVNDILPLIIESQWSSIWEVRDSCINFCSKLICDLFDSKIEQNANDSFSKLFSPVKLGISDSEEYVRASSYNAISKISSHEEHMRRMWKHEFAVILHCFTEFDQQNVSRTAHSLLLVHMVSFGYIIDLLKSSTEINWEDFEKLVVAWSQDEDWEIRRASAILIGFYAEHFNQKWTKINGIQIIDRLSYDESRWVRLAMWQTINNLFEKQVIMQLPRDLRLLSTQIIHEMIESQQENIVYDPDDEIYPLAPPVVENDLDCPF